MAEATRYANVIVSTTSGDTVTGPVSIIGVMIDQGTGSNTITIKDAGSNVIYQKRVAATTTTQMDTLGGDKGWELRNQAYTVNQSGSGATVFLYLG